MVAKNESRLEERMNYYLKRIGQAAITLFAVLTIAFVLFRLMPGSPVDAYKQQLIMERIERNEPVNIEEINNQVERYMNVEVDKPLHIAYVEYLRDAILNQDFGESITYQRPVFDVLFEAMPWSVFVSVYGLLLGFTTSIFLGAMMAYKQGTKFDYGLTVFGQVLGAVPYFVGALALLTIFAFDLGWFPTGGSYNTNLQPGFNVEFMRSVLVHGTLPILTGFVLSFGGSLGMRANAIRIIGSDYLRSAELRGIGSSRITIRYLTRNALLPAYTGILMGLAAIFSGSIIMERIFTYQGVGWYMYIALTARDYPLLMASFVFYTTITLTGLVVADLTYGLVDPRVKTGEERESF